MMLDRSAFQAWLDGYVAAWRSYDPVAIGALFSEQATYRYRPEDQPLVGRAAIVADWLRDPDAPDTWDAHYEPLAIDGETHVAQGWTRYLTGTGGVRDGYRNIFILTFDAAGQATSFTELWMQERTYARQARETAIEQALEAAGVNTGETSG